MITASMSKTSARNLNAFFFIFVILRGKKSNEHNKQRIFTSEAQVLKAHKAYKEKIKINTTSHLVL